MVQNNDHVQQDMLGRQENDDTTLCTNSTPLVHVLRTSWQGLKYIQMSSFKTKFRVGLVAGVSGEDAKKGSRECRQMKRRNFINLIL